MIAEFGVLAMLLALFFALMGIIVPLMGERLQHDGMLQSSTRFSLLQAGSIALALMLLAVAFLHDDFSVLYVVSHSSKTLPWFYKACAVWGGHEGSMLLWAGILAFWMLLVAFSTKSLPSSMRRRVLIVLSALTAGFLLFLLLTSNPFARDFSMVSSAGRDLNPLLQDVGFLFHPPMLYMGYVGFSVPFAFAIAALWEGEVRAEWFRWTRPWILASWCFLTAGITLGSWWAYRELGWGGWWFWDPVENASFMPWLVGTALMHSAMVSEKRGEFRAWTMLLAIVAFCLSLVGTFLVRSGVLTSVHAFAGDPARGIYILLFLTVVAGGSLLLFALRGHLLKSTVNASPLSRESALMINNVIMSACMLTVLMGTLYPLLVDALNLGKLSVGAPYFNTVFVPLMMPALLAMGVGIHLRWGSDTRAQVIKRIRSPLLLTMLLTPFLLALSGFSAHPSALLGAGLALWVIFTTAKALMMRRQSLGNWRIGAGFTGMALAHLGVAVCALGITVSQTFGLERDVRMKPGDSETVAGFTIRFMGESVLKGANYHGTKAIFSVEKGRHACVIYPEKRIYDVGETPMTDAAIDVTPFRDVYIALGEPLPDDAWAVRLYWKPLVRWIWGGGFLMLAGGLVALTDRRLYTRRAVA